MTDLEQIEIDARLIEQVVQNPAWEVINRRLNFGIESFIEGLLSTKITPDEANWYRQRVLAYRELLDLPTLIRKQAKDALASVGSGEEATDPEKGS
jgi:hypothetical protein